MVRKILYGKVATQGGCENMLFAALGGVFGDWVATSGGIITGSSVFYCQVALHKVEPRVEAAYERPILE